MRDEMRLAVRLCPLKIERETIPYPYGIQSNRVSTKIITSPAKLNILTGLQFVKLFSDSILNYSLHKYVHCMDSE
jgi:hypothetical protein